MLESFLVVLEDNSEALIPYAISAAKALNAHPTVAWPRRDASGREDGSIEARLETAAGAGPARKARAREDLQAFAAAAKAAGIEAEILEPDIWQDPPRDVVPRFARTFDFTMVQQRQAGRPPGRDDLTAALLAESGRPVLVVPAIHREAAQFKRVLVAWDGGAAAARAFSEAKPILAQAAHVDIVTVTSSQSSRAVSQGGQRLAERLQRAKIAAQFRTLPSEDDPANALLSYAADTSADVMVCGGYSHSRMRESLFGGATRTMLTSMTLPTLFAR
ncbi:MAG: universal stress protein [Pseudomonadota bacterium]|nr:universal stress protein [Pseudomonadota bacterium]